MKAEIVAKIAVWFIIFVWSGSYNHYHKMPTGNQEATILESMK